MSENSNENKIGVKVTITFEIPDVCFQKDLDDVDDEVSELYEFAEDHLKYDFDWNSFDYEIKDVTKISLTKQ